MFIAMAKALNFINPEELSMQCACLGDWHVQWHDSCCVQKQRWTCSACRMEWSLS